MTDSEVSESEKLPQFKPNDETLSDAENIEPVPKKKRGKGLSYKPFTDEIFTSIEKAKKYLESTIDISFRWVYEKKNKLADDTKLNYKCNQSNCLKKACIVLPHENFTATVLESINEHVHEPSTLRYGIHPETKGYKFYASFKICTSLI